MKSDFMGFVEVSLQDLILCAQNGSAIPVQAPAGMENTNAGRLYVEKATLGFPQVINAVCTLRTSFTLYMFRQNVFVLYFSGYRWRSLKSASISKLKIKSNLAPLDMPAIRLQQFTRLLSLNVFVLIFQVKIKVASKSAPKSKIEVSNKTEVNLKVLQSLHSFKTKLYSSSCPE
jgi:hypothetical protein